MSKYDFELDLSLNTSTGKILDKIRKGSKVLEFGCAEGRMTRYMKEELSCEVYICEYNEESFKNALNYAMDGVCGDILKFEWFYKFRDIKFDFVLFVDVLEHLTDSVKALTNAGKLLADDGQILISVPNVTHNDIIIKAINEHFDYTDTGLLDDTHVRFWGRENIPAFIESAGLSLKKIEATYLETGFTEQLFGNSGIHYSPYLNNLLRERDCGEIYQFIITCTKQGHDNTAWSDYTSTRINTVTGELYFNRGNGFAGDDKQTIKAKLMEKGVYQAEIKLENVAGLKEIRFDPVDNQPCIILEAIATQGKTQLDIIYPRCIIRNGEVLIHGNDPMMVIPVKSELYPISLSVKFIVLSDRFTDYVNDLAFRLSDEIEKNGSNDQGKLISELEQDKQRITAENERINDLLEKYRELVNVKDLIIIDLKKDINGKAEETTRLSDELSHQKNTLNEKEQEIGRLSRELDHYNALFVIRVRRFCGRILRRIKRMLGGNK